MGLVPEESFEYTLLDKETKIIVWRRTSEIKELMRLTAENIIVIGQKLTEVKEQLGHGKFQHWLRTEFEWSEQTARQFMQVYRWSQTIKNKNFVFSQLATSALYLLAAPSTPDEARAEVLNLVEVGEKVSYTQVKTIVNHCKKPALPSVSLENTVDTTAQSEITQPDSAGDRLFRLETPELGGIVRLYQAAELEKITDLTIGAAVKIKVGRWQGKIATIAEVLCDRQQVTQTLSPTQDRENNITIATLDRVDFSNQTQLQEMEQHLIISYGNVCLAVKASPEKLNAFTKQIQNNLAFVSEIFEQALGKQKQET